MDAVLTHDMPQAGDIVTLKGRYRNFTIRWQDLVHVYFFAAAWFALFFYTQGSVSDDRLRNATIVIGGLGLWRYSWWTTNLVRSFIFGNKIFPRMRAAADAVWNEGWRPTHMHFVMTTFHEKPATTRVCLKSIVNELRHIGVPGTLWVGTGAAVDEREIELWLKNAPDVPLDVVIVRQNLPGKRCAIATTLRALSRRGVKSTDMVAMMDGDSIFIDGALQKCLSIFGAYPDIKALTTDEEAISHGPVWTQKWLTMRFAQRRMWMMSHALSKRVLTLTGRMSVIRAEEVVEENFIRMVEADHLDHWFWGGFRFLSGDDKSTWYCLLKKRSQMTYVPDAMVYTIEHIEGNAVIRARDNLLRWSGNMLRNGTRAIALGPRVVPPYIWWCLIDQRLAIWSTLAGFFTAMSVINFVNPQFLYTYILWVSATRLGMSIGLFCHSERIHMSYPPILYCNQVGLAFIKLYISFRLPLQRWANRLDQRSGAELTRHQNNRQLALALNIFYIAVLLLGVFLVTGILKWPNPRLLFL